MSMIADTKWSSKDGFSADPVTWCSKIFATEAEETCDWIVAQNALNYDANLKTLRATFSRKLVGSNQDDYTFKIGGEYEYMLIFGNWASAADEDVATALADTGTKTLKILPATFDMDSAYRYSLALSALAASATLYL